jgi:hypothetical protein
MGFIRSGSSSSDSAWRGAEHFYWACISSGIFAWILFFACSRWEGAYTSGGDTLAIWKILLIHSFCVLKSLAHVHILLAYPAGTPDAPSTYLATSRKDFQPDAV